MFGGTVESFGSKWDELS